MYSLFFGLSWYPSLDSSGHSSLVAMGQWSSRTPNRRPDRTKVGAHGSLALGLLATASG